MLGLALLYYLFEVISLLLKEFVKPCEFCWLPSPLALASTAVFMLYDDYCHANFLFKDCMRKHVVCCFAVIDVELQSSHILAFYTLLSREDISCLLPDGLISLFLLFYMHRRTVPCCMSSRSALSPHLRHHWLLSSDFLQVVARWSHSKHLKHFLRFGFSLILLTTHPILIFLASISRLSRSHNSLIYVRIKLTMSSSPVNSSISWNSCITALILAWSPSTNWSPSLFRLCSQQYSPFARS